MDDDESRARGARARNSAAARAQRLGNRNRSISNGGGGGSDSVRGGRGRGAMSARGRGGRAARGLNEAAAALLGMALPDDDEYMVRSLPRLIMQIMRHVYITSMDAVLHPTYIVGDIIVEMHFWIISEPISITISTQQLLHK